MKTKTKRKTFLHQSRNIILIFISLASLMILSAIIELYQSKKELYQLMEEQAHTLLESLIVASKNSLLTNTYLEDLWKERLLNNGNLIKKLYENGNLSSELLENISTENNIYRINIYDRRGQKLLSSHQQKHFGLVEANSPQKILLPIFSGTVDTLIIGIKKARYEKGYRFAVALALKNRGAIVLNIDARQILEFKQHIGFGALLRNVTVDNPRIIYAALQDTANILAASGNVKVLEGVTTSDFLSRSWQDSLLLTRIVAFDSLEVFEAVHPFVFNNETVGLLRVGLSIEPIQDINERIYRRLIIITIVLVVVGSFMITFIFTRQRFSMLQKQYDVVETYSGNIIDNVSDAIIVFDQVTGIKIFNSAAEKLSKLKKDEVLGTSPLRLFSDPDGHKILSESSLLQHVNCVLNGQTKFLLISKSRFSDSEGVENIILVMRDLTHQRLLEEQMEREKRLTAMGELASGVAHEIRNPLNTIGTIIQQLKKDFEPKKDSDEYHELAGLVASEVKRINETIQDFLRFARPEPIQVQSFQVETLFNQLEKQYHYLMKERQINLNVVLDWNGKVLWDHRQILQVFMNIIQNAVDAIGKNGNITISLIKINDRTLEIRVEDDGPGMPDKIRNNIFNLYFTTKAKGTGIGLSIVQRIIYEHGGIITVESEKQKGTSFIIQLPIRFQKV
jgi:two-component system sensor histidine kinase HydH